ncbi:hypothetical protein [Candidatus Berkiella aquae]|uniref:Uncharacterized protein n=1 Tax=Candidatus Berkiella aquae TaxID=295108 RepID=A0A0Q9YVA9_9GAMM|nr:hypothetical protein [Candidatus Berkiella aquae]MCS5711290.1 hypothetical protein [Candidatus Berkiella aquae]
MSLNQEPQRSIYENHCLHYYKVKTINWSAVISGAMIAFGLTFLFNLLTLGIGLTIISTSEQGVRDLAFNGFIWSLIGGVIILFIAGWKTGKLIKLHPSDIAYCHEKLNANLAQASAPMEVCKTKCCYHGMTHGFLAWALYLIISLVFTFLLSHATAVSSLNSSFLNIPLGIPQAVAETANTAKVQQKATAEVPISPKTAEKAGIEIIGIFLIFTLGAAASSIGCHLGLLCHRKCVTANLNK